MFGGKFISLVSFLFGCVCIYQTEGSAVSLEGSPAGFLSDCPKETLLVPSRPPTEKELKTLTFIVHGAKSHKKIRYNYYQTHLMAKSKTMDWNKKTLIYIGGFLDHPLLYYAMTTEEHYINLGYNVWLLDTFSFSLGEYPVAVRMLRSAGYAAGNMLANLTKAGILDPKNIEILGFSLGAHTSAFMAKRYHQLTGYKLNRLTAIDPSGPCYRDQPIENRLDKSDAEFVEALHTNIDAFGMATPVGHVDYYINGGEFQYGPSTWMGCDTYCSHFRAFHVWMAALEYPGRFIAIECNSVQQARDKECYSNQPRVTKTLGLAVDRNTDGLFYLATKNIPPFYMAEDGLNKDNEVVAKLFKKFLKMYPS